MITDKYILFGEWCYAQHSIYYNNLPDWFIGFDIFDKEKEKFLSVEKRDNYFQNMGVKKVPQLGKGIFCVEDLHFFFGKSKFADGQCEGIYIRQDQGDYLKARAKMVQTEFKQSISEHWSKSGIKCNKITWKYLQGQ